MPCRRTLVTNCPNGSNDKWKACVSFLVTQSNLIEFQKFRFDEIIESASPRHCIS